MPTTLVVPQTMFEALDAFVTAQGFDLSVAVDAPETDGDVIRVVAGDRSQQSEPNLLVAGGRIRCAIGLGMAERLGLPALALGALLDELKIKVGTCSLGCF